VAGQCPFYRATSTGTRCVLLSREDWEALKSKYIGMCKNRGLGCPVLNRLLRINGSGEKFLSSFREKERKGMIAP